MLILQLQVETVKLNDKVMKSPSSSFYDIRDKYFKEISDRYSVSDTFINMTKIVFFFNNGDHFICRSVAAYVKICMDKRKERL